jgi:uncharacterized protein YbaR (Trm112 family)
VAKQISTTSQTVEREIGDACPRECPGTLQKERSSSVAKPGSMLECDVCRRHFNVKFSIPMTDEDRNGVEVAMYLPDDIVMALIQAKHKNEMAIMFPNPKDREGEEDWFEGLSAENQEKWKEETRAQLEPVWPMIAEWFGGVPNFAAAMRQRDAVRAIQEIAVPSLKYCEEQYGHDDQARLNLEAAIREA